MGFASRFGPLTVLCACASVCACDHDDSQKPLLGATETLSIYPPTPLVTIPAFAAAGSSAVVKVRFPGARKGDVAIVDSADFRATGLVSSPVAAVEDGSASLGVIATRPYGGGPMAMTIILIRTTN